MENFRAALFVEPFNIAAYSALVLHYLVYGIFRVAQVVQAYFKSRVEECLLAQSFLKGIVAEYSGVEYLAVGLEGYGGTGVICIAYDLDRLLVFTAVEMLEVDMLSVVYLDLKPF